MPLFTYVGDLPVRELWGVDFPRGEAVQVDDPDLAQKCRGLGFVEGEADIEPLDEPETPQEPAAGEIELFVDVDTLMAENAALRERVAELESQLTPDEPETVAEDDPDLEIPHRGAEKPEDYVAEDEKPEEPSIPVLGEGVLPEGWREEHWKTRQKWCKELLGLDVADGAEANDALEKAING